VFQFRDLTVTGATRGVLERPPRRVSPAAWNAARLVPPTLVESWFREADSTPNNDNEKRAVPACFYQ